MSLNIAFKISAIDGFSSTMSKLDESLNSIKSSANTLSTKIKSVGDSLSHMGEQGIDAAENFSQAVGLPVAALGGLAVASALATEEGKALGDKFTQAFDQIKEALAPVGIVIMEIAAQYLPLVVEKVQQVSEWFTNLDANTQKLIVGFGAFLVAIGPLIMFLGGLSIGIGGVLKSIGSLSSAFSFLMSPVGLVILLIAGLVAAFIWAYKKIDWFREGVDTAWAWIKDAFSTALEFISGVVKNVFNAVASFIFIQLTKIKAFWAQNGDQIMAAAKNVWETIKSVVKTGMDFIKKVIEIAWPIIQRIVETAWNVIKTVIDTGVDVILGIIKFFSQVFTGDWESAFDTVLQIARDIWDGIKEVFSIALSIIKNAISAGFNWIKSIISTVMNSVKSAIDYIWNAIKKVFNTTVNTIKTTIENGFNAIKNVISNLFTGAKNKIVEIWNSIEKFFSGIDLYQIGRDIIQGLVNGITSMVSSLMSKARDIANSVKNTIKDALNINSPSRVMIEIGGFIGEGLALGMTDVIPNIEKSSLKLASATVPEIGRSEPIPSNPNTSTRRNRGDVIINVHGEVIDELAFQRFARRISEELGAQTGGTF
jgi:phage-related protein